MLRLEEGVEAETHIEPVEFIVRKREAPSSVGPPAGPREFAPVNALNDDGIPS